MGDKGATDGARRAIDPSPHFAAIRRNGRLVTSGAAWHVVRKDHVTILALAVYLALAVGYTTGLVPPTAPWTDLAFLVVVQLGIASGLRHVENRNERRFWIWLSMAFAAWFLTALLFLPLWSPSAAKDLAEDSLYAIYFLTFILAIECRPHHPDDGSLGRIGPVWPREGFFVAGLLIYFCSIPLALDREEYLVSAELFYLALEGYLALRLLGLYRQATQLRWKLTYVLLAFTSCYYVAVHFVGLYHLTHSGDWPWPTRAALAWNAQFLIFMVATRLGHWLPATEEGAAAPSSWDETPAALRRRTLALTLVFPLIHLVVYSLGLAGEACRPARELTQLTWLVLLGSLALLQHWYLEKRNQRLVSETAAMADEIESRKKVQVARQRFAVELEAKVAEVEAHNAEMGRFARTVSHELRNPLTTISNFLGLLDKDSVAKKTPAIERDVGRIEAATKKLAHYLSGLLELSRVGRQRQQPEEVAIQELALEAAAGLADKIADRGVDVEVTDKMPLVSGDRHRLRELLQALFDNAVKFLGKQTHPRIEVGFRPEGGGAIYYVRDNGIGVEPRYRERIFGLFDQLNQSFEGTGLGLALARRIVEVHGGRIWIESNGEERGSTFCFMLPRPATAAGQGLDL